MTRKFSLISILLICLAGFLVYSNSLNGMFVFDDHSFIENNPAIYKLFNFEAIIKFHPSRPFGTYTFAMDYFLWGLNPFGYHVTNLLIHLAASVLVWWFLTMLLKSPSQKWLSLTAALIFAVHPVHTEAVNYITQRYTSLAGFFYLAAVCCYVRARLFNDDWRFYAASLIAALLGAWTRETLITLPAVLLMTEYYFIEGTKGVSFSKAQVKYFLLLIAVLAVIPLAYSFNVSSIWADKGFSHSHEAEQITAGNYFLTQFRVLAVYIGLLVLPLQQNFEYDFAVSKSFFEPAVFFCFIFLAALIILARLIRRKKPLISFGIFWFFVTISIEGGLIPIPYVINEYRTYLPSVGYCIVLSALVLELIKTPRLAAIVAALFIAGYSNLTFERNKVWQDEIVFWEDVVRKSPHKSRPYDNLAQSYLAAGNSEKAVENLHKALAINPHNAATYTNLGVAYLGLGNNEEALRQFDRALRILSDSGWAWNNRGVVFLNLGNETEAQKSFEEAMKTKEIFLEPRLNLAGIYLRRKDPVKAAELYRQALELYPHDGNSYAELLKISLEQNDLGRAVSVIQQMLSTVDDPALLTAAGSVAASHNLSDVAYKLFAKAIKNSAAGRTTYIELGKFYANHNKFDAAVRVWENGLTKFQDDEFESLIAQAREIEKNLEQ